MSLSESALFCSREARRARTASEAFISFGRSGLASNERIWSGNVISVQARPASRSARLPACSSPRSFPPLVWAKAQPVAAAMQPPPFLMKSSSACASMPSVMPCALRITTSNARSAARIHLPLKSLASNPRFPSAASAPPWRTPIRGPSGRKARRTSGRRSPAA